jgi:hypothetical protein
MGKFVWDVCTYVESVFMFFVNTAPNRSGSQCECEDQTTDTCKYVYVCVCVCSYLVITLD